MTTPNNNAAGRPIGDSGSQLTVEQKAALWDALTNCNRIRILGWARSGPDGKTGPINHIGFEFTAKFNPKSAVELNTEIGRQRLTEFAQGMIANTKPQVRGLPRPSGGAG